MPPASGPNGGFAFELKEFEDLQSRAGVGLALGGGGIRSASQMNGVFQVLLQHDVLKKVRYVSSCSGASWFLAPFAFLPEAFGIETFLSGPPLGAKALTLPVLRDLKEGSWLKAAGNAKGDGELLCAACADDCCLETCQITACCPSCPRLTLRAWNQVMAADYLEPFKLGSQRSVMALPVGTGSHSRAAEAMAGSSVTVNPLRRGGPYPIITAARPDPSAPTDSWLPVEFAPLACGTPVLDEKARGGPVGGGVIESFGYNSLGPGGSKTGRTEVQDGDEVSVIPDFFVPLALAAGTSGAGYTLILKNKTVAVELAGGPTVQLWSPADTTSDNNKLSALCDSGPNDTTAILALLRRGVRKIIAPFSSRNALTDDITSLTGNSWMPALFGRNIVAPTSEASIDLMNRNCKVFASSELDSMFDGLRSKQREGGPPVFQQTLDVFKNKWCGVLGGWQVTIVWVYPDLTDTFRDNLPPDTKQKLTEPPKVGPITECVYNLFPIAKTKNIAFSEKEIDSTFPYDATNWGYYSPELCHLLAEAMANNLQEGMGAAQIEAFFDD
uniref:PLA2c domain-containing protein n=1 Tax=Zooxanthella nutricula TaxID=1333877 RepID=A0A7S2QCH3_9DINO